MLERDVGIYEAIATNEHGEARQRVRMDIAEYPTFIERPDETIIMLRKSGRITARVIGVPYPDIKWCVNYLYFCYIGFIFYTTAWKETIIVCKSI